MAIKAILFDISGVLYEDDQPLPGALEIIKKLQDDAVPMRFVTNTSRSTTATILSNLQSMGFEVTEQQVLTAPGALKHFCLEHQLRPYCLIHPDLASEFSELEQSDPNAVIVADAAKRFDYEHLNKAFSILMNGAPLLGIGLNRYFRSQGELQLDAGPFIKALEYASGCEAKILGKPSKDFFTTALVSLGLSANEVLMIGDDIEADVLGAMTVGLHACLVKTGKYLADDEHKFPNIRVADDVREAVHQYFYQQDKSWRKQG